MANAKTRVVVAMSGGVDSSVAAALLKQQGHDVIGVSLKLWDYDEDERKLAGKTCCSLDDIADAKDVCDTLGIPFYAFNHKLEFSKRVIDVFVSEYAKGRTPNPCVLCNRDIKFGILMREARKMGAEYLATGHYARIHRDTDGTYRLLRGVDPGKDQSYVLFHLTQDELRSVIFPVGDYTKTEIRDIARRHGLSTHAKKESMEICFIPNNDHASFIAKNYPALASGPGRFVNARGETLGSHSGIERYTIGQRRGLRVGFGKRMYVGEIRREANEVVLMDDDEVHALSVVVADFRFINAPRGASFGAKIRSQSDVWPCELTTHDFGRSRAEFRFLQPTRAVTPGQPMVIYDGDEVMGGGWIDRAEGRGTRDGGLLLNQSDGGRGNPC